ncbi:SH3 domain-containing protein [Occultella glacieicola]|uniref:SH3 domain-containing protein n=1 Tax=Occultella glacieicola TaxID=2518684 RepID=A0ABY2E8Y5_9MICO|nr:SH3 domain-containing protein [Occultella glacieicola]TDE97452.1 SH3 domain-containing protein [Occultella glacieicola]
MPAGRHRAVGTRRTPLSRMLGAAAAGAFALASLAAAVPVDQSPATRSTAQAPVPFIGTDGTDGTDGTAGTVLDERSDEVAQRSEARESVDAPTPTPTPDPATSTPEPLPEVTGQLWVTSAVNVRSGPSVDDERLTTFAWADAVDVTGASADGWTQVIWGERVAWVSSNYLADEEPVAQEPEDPGVSGAACTTSQEIESSLAANAAAAYRAVCAAFPGVASAYGGYRAGDGGDHGSGHALDIMVTGAAGWEIAGFLQAHAGELGITYLIFEQQIWMAGDATGAWAHLADRGSATANHYDHVHASTS